MVLSEDLSEDFWGPPPGLPGDHESEIGHLRIHGEYQNVEYRMCEEGHLVKVWALIDIFEWKMFGKQFDFYKFYLVLEKKNGSVLYIV